MASNDLVSVNSVQQHCAANLALASLRDVFALQDVQTRLDKLAKSADKDQQPLRETYQRMLERGPQRFQVKPNGLPEMAALYQELPNFCDPLDDVKRQVALSYQSRDGVEIVPMLLLGAPGIGKTHFAKRIADLFGTGMNLVPMSSMTAGWLLSGSSSQWKGAKPGKVFQALVDGEYANPVIVVDEIDKASSDAQYDPLGALYSLLEHDTAKHFMDEYAEVSIDASQVIWVLTANDERNIPEPILNRMNVFEVPSPSLDQARVIASNLYKSIRGEHDWGAGFSDQAKSDVLDCLAKLAPREMRRALMTAFGNASLASRSQIEVQDLPKAVSGRQAIGFS
jgi:ATP-dependent Lon protease